MKRNPRPRKRTHRRGGRKVRSRRTRRDEAPRDAAGEGLRRRPGRPAAPPAERRARLLDAARSALQETDYESLRISDVVHGAGMSSRSFYQHFDSKEDILVELIREAGSDLLAEIQSIFRLKSAEERVDRIVEAYLRACVSTPLDIDRLSSGLTSRVQQLVRVTVRDLSVQIAEALRRLWPKGAPRPAPNPVIIEVMFLGMLGVASRYVHERRVEELQAVRPALREMLLHAWS